jgi:hypothetical protein
MADWTDEDLNDILGTGENDNSTIRVLREKIKADNAAMKAMQAEVASLRDARKNDVVGEILLKAGLNPKVGKFYQGEADPTAVQAWVEENADVFGSGTTAVTSDNTPSPMGGIGELRQNVVTVPPITPEVQVDYQRMLNAGVDGVPPSNYNDIMGALMSAQDENAFAEAMRRFQ